MRTLAWEQSYALRIPPMDRQHQELFVHLDNLLTAVRAGSSQASSGEQLQALEIYSKMHFYDEERLMASRNYPSLAEHRHQHDLFIQLLEQVSRDPGAVIGLRDWFVNHILTEDIRYAEFFLNRNPVPASPGPA